MILDKKVFIGTSGGINSAAVIVKTIEAIKAGDVPSELHLMYCHIDEHSPDTLAFVEALRSYCIHHFPATKYYQTQHSILEYFEKSKMIPHPTASTCTRQIKTEPIEEYKSRHCIDIDLIGYVKQEKIRIKNLVSKKTGQEKKDVDVDYYIANGLQDGLFHKIEFPTVGMTDEDCFTIVDNAIGWHPSIYDLLWTDSRIIPFLESVKDIMPIGHFNIAIKYALRGFNDAKSIRVFAHNNCLPCKNMQTWQFWLVKLFFPKYFAAATATAKKIGSYYGRDEKEYEKIIIYTSFGREPYEVDYKEQSCGTCAED